MNLYYNDSLMQDKLNIKGQAKHKKVARINMLKRINVRVVDASFLKYW